MRAWLIINYDQSVIYSSKFKNNLNELAALDVEKYAKSKNSDKYSKANSINDLNSSIKSTKTIKDKSNDAKEKMAMLSNNIEKLSGAATELATHIEQVSR